MYKKKHNVTEVVVVVRMVVGGQTAEVVTGLWGCTILISEAERADERAASHRRILGVVARPPSSHLGVSARLWVGALAGPSSTGGVGCGGVGGGGGGGGEWHHRTKAHS